MKTYFNKAITLLRTHRKQILKVSSITIATVVTLLLAALFIYNSTPHYTYAPINACDLYPEKDAYAILGDKVLGNVTKPTIKDSLSTSKCSYSDMTKDEGAMRVIALAVQSSVNDEGIPKLQQGFAATKSDSKNIETISGVGTDAYFNKNSGQLNILTHHAWLIVSYGIGESPENNDVQSTVNIAKTILSRLDQ